MTKGRKGEATYSGYNGARESSLRAMGKLKRTPAGEFGRVTNPESVESIRSAIAAGLCPWCGEGPYKIVALHTNRAHGVNKVELRDLAGLTKNTSICAPEISEGARARSKERGTPAAFGAHGRKKKRVYTQEGLRRQREKLAKARLAARPPGSPAQAALAREALVRKKQEQYAPIREEIRKLWGQRLAIKEIADATGVSPRYVRQVMRESGETVDGRARRHTIKSSDERRASMEAASAVVAERRKTERDSRLQCFETLGSDWSAVGQLAREWQVSKKAAAAYLRRSGATVPDGRAT